MGHRSHEYSLFGDLCESVRRREEKKKTHMKGKKRSFWVGKKEGGNRDKKG